VASQLLASGISESGTTLLFRVYGKAVQVKSSDSGDAKDSRGTAPRSPNFDSG
jgi:hypothetical protein